MVNSEIVMLTSREKTDAARLLLFGCYNLLLEPC
jgi:hypothetical protein